MGNPRQARSGERQRTHAVSGSRWFKPVAGTLLPAEAAGIDVAITAPMRLWRLSILPIAVLITILLAGCSKRVDNSQHAPAIERLVSTTPSWVERGSLGKRLWEVERAF